MLFNSLDFLVFLLIVLTVYYGLIPAGHRRARKAFLLVASYFFYMSWNPVFGTLLLASTLLDFWVGIALERSTRRRALLLAVSLIGNLGILGFFKYGNFLADNLWFLLGPVTGFPDPPMLHILLPVGISFYTFQSLSYSIDVYRGTQRATRSILDFALYISFFPQLVAGPIVRAGTFLPEAENLRSPTGPEVENAMMRIATGLLKKVVFADSLGLYVDRIFEAPHAFGGLSMLLAIYAYAYQIYFDFSGYSDMAIGLAELLGFRIPENFNRPYLAASPREFWRRWHMSLSTWFRDYLYISLGGNRRGPGRTYCSLAVTMILAGLWHGAAWNFVLWGAFHGVWLMVHRALFGSRPADAARLPRWVRQLCTFHLVCLGWVIFRAPALETAIQVVARLASPALVPPPLIVQTAVLLGLAIGFHIATSVTALRRSYTDLPPWLQGVGYATITSLVFLFSPTTQRFIYFQF